MASVHDALVFIGGVGLTLLLLLFIHNIKGATVTVPYRSKGITISWIPKTVTHWSPTINEMAKRYNIDPNLVAIIMTMESGGDDKAKSEAGAIGLMQVTPPTASDIAVKHLKTSVQKYDLTNPETNIEFGVAYLAYLRSYFGMTNQGPNWNATVELIAAGYNGGPGAAAKLEDGKGLEDSQTVVYSRDAFNMWRERASKTSPTFERWKERGGSDLLSAATQSQ